MSRLFGFQLGPSFDEPFVRLSSGQAELEVLQRYETIFQAPCNQGFSYLFAQLPWATKQKGRFILPKTVKRGLQLCAQLDASQTVSLARSV